MGGVTNAPVYVALPNGNCSITISTDCDNCVIRNAKSFSETYGEIHCINGCSGIVNIDDEYYMINIYHGSYNYMSLAYNCI